MATPVLIDLTNYSTLLKQSTQGRSGTPDGNIFFDVANGRIELITAEELAQVNFGSGLEANPLTNQLGVKLEALYAFERQERRVDENLRKYDPYFKGSFKYAGAYELVNGRKFDDADGSATSSTTDDRAKIRGSGWRELNAAGAIGRIYYGNVSLGNIEATSQPYYQLSDGGAPNDYQKAGSIDEAVQVFGNAAVDANTTTFDSTTFLALNVRTYGNNFDRKVLADSGVTKMDGYSSGFALSESTHLTTNTTNMPFASVYNATPSSQVGVWQNMTLEELDTPQVETGFVEADGNFSWVLNNPSGASLNECVAYLDAIATVDADINAHASNTTFGKRVGLWYGYNAAGKILHKVGTGQAGKGLFIEGLVGTDKQNVIFTDDSGATKTYPFYVSVSVNVGAGAVADTNAWFHAYFQTAFNTAGAVTVQDKTATQVKGNVSASPFRSGTNIVFEFDYAGDTLGGTANTDKFVVFECEGDGGVTAAKTIFQIINAATVTASAVPPAETNV